MVTTTNPFAGLGLDIDKFFATPTAPAYPPYNVIKVDEDEWILEFAVAGLNKDHLEITTHKGVLTIKFDNSTFEIREGWKYLHKGIANRKFARSFSLPEYTEVLKAETVDGILSITLVRSVPEEQKPKVIEIN